MSHTIKAEQFQAVLKKFKDQGEKTGWTYVEVPANITEKIKGNFKKSFRVKGSIDNYELARVALIPMGDGNFILPVKGVIRKSIKKIKGDTVMLSLAEDKSGMELNKDFAECLSEDTEAAEYFNSLPEGHKNYFNNWINSAKTSPTIAKRISMVLEALSYKMDFGEMIRNQKKSN